MWHKALFYTDQTRRGGFLQIAGHGVQYLPLIFNPVVDNERIFSWR
jgi:hypothetical protein